MLGRGPFGCNSQDEVQDLLPKSVPRGPKTGPKMPGLCSDSRGLKYLGIQQLDFITGEGQEEAMYCTYETWLILFQLIKHLFWLLNVVTQAKLSSVSLV